MRILPVFFTLLTALLICSCEKNNASQLPNYNDSTEIREAVTFKIIVTHPSPWDSANGPLTDSFSMNEVVTMGGDLPGINMSIFPPPGSGIGFSYSSNNQLSLILDYNAIPVVNTEFLLNHVYSDTNTQNFPSQPVFLSMPGGNGVGRYFKDTIPPDGSSQPLATTTYSQITFTNNFSSNQLGNSDLVYFADGVISGYEILSYGTLDPNKYVQRWDFEITFKSLTYHIL